MTIRRNQGLMGAYIKENGFSCMVPGCGSLLGAETHHIQPISRGGSDTEDNYIVLCDKHHMNSHYHRDWQQWRVTLLTWKFYYESGGRGGDSIPITPAPRSIKPHEPVSLCTAKEAARYKKCGIKLYPREGVQILCPKKCEWNIATEKRKSLKIKEGDFLFSKNRPPSRPGRRWEGDSPSQSAGPAGF